MQKQHHPSRPQFKSSYEQWVEKAYIAAKKNPEYFRVLDKHHRNFGNYPEIAVDEFDFE